MAISKRIPVAFALACACLSSAWAQPIEAVTFGRVIMGNLGGGVGSSTELLLTNKDPNQATCRVLVVFNQAAASLQPVLINGQIRTDNTIEVDIPRGGARKVRYTTNGDLITGATLVAPFVPCDENSIAGNGRFQLESGGGLNEFYSIRPNTAARWLTDDQCQAISTCFRRTADGGGFGNNLGLAATSVFPGFPPQTGSSLDTMVFDAEGNQIEIQRSFPFDGSHQAFFPLDSFTTLQDGPITLIVCLSASDPTFKVDLTTIAVGTDTQGGVQFDAPDFTDGFESGDTTAWRSARADGGKKSKDR